VGAKITSLKSLRTGREWMWRVQEPLKLFANQMGDDFSRSPLVGVDECIPSVGACVWKGRRVADHGEVWFMPWELDSEAWDNEAILTRVAMPVSPFFFERSIRLDGGEVTIDYRLANTGAQAEEYLWAIHPMMTIFPGDRIVLPADVREVRYSGGLGYGEMPENVMWGWPKPEGGVHLDDLDLFGAGRAVKLFIDQMREGRASIVNTGRKESFTFLWDVNENPALGIWVCSGGWNGYYHVALEPTNAGAETLAEAAQRSEAFRPLPTGASRLWRLRLKLEEW
jgi:hypothetical protein